MQTVESVPNSVYKHRVGMRTCLQCSTFETRKENDWIHQIRTLEMALLVLHNQGGYWRLFLAWLWTTVFTIATLGVALAYQEKVLTPIEKGRYNFLTTALFLFIGLSSLVRVRISQRRRAVFNSLTGSLQRSCQKSWSPPLQLVQSKSR